MDKFIKEKNGFRGSDFNPATLCVLNSQELTTAKLARLGASSLCAEFPVIRGHFVYDEPIVGIQWLKTCVRNITIQIIYARFWIKERVDASRYGLVPLGNLDNGSSPGPTPAAMIDTMFARALKRDRHVLWYSDERGLPDLGGHESEDFRAYFQEAIQNPEKAIKGLYRGGYTIEVNVQDLVVNTVLQSENLHEFEETLRAASAQANSKSKAPTTIDTDLDEVITCAPSFKVLRGLLRSWDQDRRQNKPADQLCLSFTRWLQSPSNAPSRLHDPLLQRLVHRLSHQVFNLLMKRLKMLDCKVIYASFHKLLIYTGKATDEDAKGHVSFAIRTVQRDPLFSKLSLEIGESYSILLFKDIANMAGVREAEPTRTFLSMDIVGHLPEAIRVHFGDLVQLFIAQIAAHNRMLAKQRDN
jgi:DNA polymerase epsilon subunit 1